VGASAQELPPAAGSVARGCASAADKSRCVALDKDRKVELPVEPRGGEPSGEITLFGNLTAIVKPQTDIARETASFGETWRVKTGLRFEAPGGIELTASTSARRGYALPLAMVQAPGSDVQLPEFGNVALEFGSASTHWDTELRVRKTITSKGPVQLSIVGEAFNLLNLNHASDATPPGSTRSVSTAPNEMLTSPTFRVGIVLGF
jgi:hypothetical protein